MPIYISLLRFTQQGITAIKQGPSRMDAAKQAYKRAGGELKTFYITLGQYDAIAIAELPDDETAATFSLSLGAQGNVRSETLRAFSEAEYRKIVSAMP
jgi:uncharacterized protein with GYD domain